MTIYVALVGECTDAWRPVEADWVSGDVYRISAQPYDREDERWEFEPGEEVHCQGKRLSTGTVLVAVTTARRGPSAPR